jgi:hypothetical protein
MDADLLALIREIAELPTSCETPGVALDFELDNLVFTARLRLNMPNGRTFVREMETGKREISGPISVAIELMLKEEDSSAAWRESGPFA